MILLAALCSLVGFFGRGMWDVPAIQAGSEEREATTQIGTTNGDVNGDGTLDISDGVYILSWLFTGGPSPVPIDCPPSGSGTLPATGQTECYGTVDGQGWTAVPCEGAESPGQDGAYRAGCQSESRFMDNGDGTVTDTCTGLMWQEDIADVNEDGASHGDSGDAVSWTGAIAYCEGLSFAGYDDWRLPNVRELQSIVDYGRDSPAIDPVFGVLDNYCWSSSTYADHPVHSWLVFFGDGRIIVTDESKEYRYHVLAVRRGL